MFGRCSVSYIVEDAMLRIGYVRSGFYPLLDLLIHRSEMTVRTLYGTVE